MEVRGYKVFNPDWTCRGKQYTCPGEFEEKVELRMCNAGMHFCKRLEDCFSYYDFDPENKVAEVAALGEILEEDKKSCTNKLKIIRELTWQEVLDRVNVGVGCTGLGNSGSHNSGYWNSGDYNSGSHNSGDYNSGDYNSGYWNSGSHNSGNYNSGDDNSGNYNSGDYNSGYWNSGYWNSGNYNSGIHNSGDYNSGNYNSGDYNSGDYNSGSYSNGCFNTIESKIYLFNKPSNWTLPDWLNSEARQILKTAPHPTLNYVNTEKMTKQEKKEHPEAEITGGYLRKTNQSADIQQWWNGLSKHKKTVIQSIPNFDKGVFKEITGIDVE